MRPDLACVNFRGNVDTRLMKLERGDVAATLLACAGLNRLGLGDRIAAPIDIAEMLPAVAQGAIGIETRENDERVRALVAAIDHAATATTVSCERAFLAMLDGSCRTPIAGHARFVNDTLQFRGEALLLDGSATFEAARVGNANDAVRMGREAGAEIKAKGGERLLLGR
jgi:hydroxymethylbilane synthase